MCKYFTGEAYFNVYFCVCSVWCALTFDWMTHVNPPPAPVSTLLSLSLSLTHCPEETELIHAQARVIEAAQHKFTH